MRLTSTIANQNPDKNNKVLSLSNAAVFAPLLSMLTFLGNPLDPIALLKKARTALRSRFSDSIKSTVLPYLSTAR